jgi:hypothetical protein
MRPAWVPALRWVYGSVPPYACERRCRLQITDCFAGTWPPAFDYRQPRRISTLSMVACSCTAARARPDAKAKSATPPSDVSVPESYQCPLAAHIVRCRIAGQSAESKAASASAPDRLNMTRTTSTPPSCVKSPSLLASLRPSKGGSRPSSWVSGQVDGASAGIADSLRDRHLRGPNQTSDLGIDSPPWQAR